MGQARSDPVTPCHAPWDRVRRLPRLIDGGRWTRRNYTALDTSITVHCDTVSHTVIKSAVRSRKLYQPGGSLGP